MGVLTVQAPVAVRVRLLAGKDMLPSMVGVPVPARVMVWSRLPMVSAEQATEPLKVTVNPVPASELPSKLTSQPSTGKAPTVLPPDESDQLAVLVVSQVPDPPIQYMGNPVNVMSVLLPPSVLLGAYQVLAVLPVAQLMLT